MSSSKTNDMMY
ncbi:hypothetical protein F383_31405 [Gossypium arboreum]|uniref:Uncharacterized protein n=1 Tax=Gossypium arboreum TaxID=29729 RepID=A0A0B0MDY8_GOSAR|nr:hypothetical protein F383_38081 [Gossypium arboreum]KHG19814.1 hypothetical protein F383_25119 [Gossypium arboreum]KHG21906.1 hypothetical protein F383_01751 [Gossypium arboreum]KHG24635.1 hypothetical protein F383_31405 [Gossypium arboreum]